MERERFLDLLGLWTQGSGPLYQQLASALRQAIAATEIPAETRLPAERLCAKWLGLSRSTVVAAYRVLAEEGWAESRHGSGTWVKELTPQRSSQHRSAQLSLLARGPVYDAFLAEQVQQVDLATGAVFWPERLPAEAYLPTRAELAALGSEYGYLPQGYGPLRRAIARYYELQGVPTSPEQILITTGAQQAIVLVAACFLQRGDALLIESPTYFGAIDAFRSLGLRLQSVPVTRAGLNLERLQQRLQAGGAEWLYLIPTLHNPTATSLTEGQRRSVVQMAEQWGVTIIEDLTMADLMLTDQRPAPLAAYAPNGPIISLGSLSKIIWGGLRVGWVRASAGTIARLARFKAIQDRGSPILNQIIATHLFANLPAVLQLRRQELQQGLTCMEAHLSQWLPTWHWDHPVGGLFLWVQLPEGDANELAQLAVRAGVLVTSGSSLSVDEDHTQYLRLAYIRPPQEITRGLERLRLAWREYAYKRVRYHLVPQILV